MQWDRVHTFGTVNVGDLDAIELAEARVRVVSLWGVGIIGGGDGSASAGRGVIDSTLGAWVVVSSSMSEPLRPSPLLVFHSHVVWLVGARVEGTGVGAGGFG